MIKHFVISMEKGVKWVGKEVGIFKVTQYKKVNNNTKGYPYLFASFTFAGSPLSY